MSRRSKKNTVKLPAIDGELKPGQLYYARNTISNLGSIITKEQMKEMFFKRFGQQPAVIFYGKPKGSLIYAGPIGEG